MLKFARPTQAELEEHGLRFAAGTQFKDIPPGVAAVFGFFDVFEAMPKERAIAILKSQPPRHRNDADGVYPHRLYVHPLLKCRLCRNSSKTFFPPPSTPLNRVPVDSSCLWAHCDLGYDHKRGSMRLGKCWAHSSPSQSTACSKTRSCDCEQVLLELDHKPTSNRWDSVISGSISKILRAYKVVLSDGTVLRVGEEGHLVGIEGPSQGKETGKRSLEGSGEAENGGLAQDETVAGRLGTGGIDSTDGQEPLVKRIKIKGTGIPDTSTLTHGLSTPPPTPQNDAARSLPPGPLKLKLRVGSGSPPQRSPPPLPTSSSGHQSVRPASRAPAQLQTFESQTAPTSASGDTTSVSIGENDSRKLVTTAKPAVSTSTTSINNAADSDQCDQPRSVPPTSSVQPVAEQYQQSFTALSQCVSKIASADPRDVDRQVRLRAVLGIDLCSIASSVRDGWDDTAKRCADSHKMLENVRRESAEVAARVLGLEESLSSTKAALETCSGEYEGKKEELLKMERRLTALRRVQTEHANALSAKEAEHTAAMASMQKELDMEIAEKDAESLGLVKRMREAQKREKKLREKAEVTVISLQRQHAIDQSDSEASIVAMRGEIDTLTKSRNASEETVEFLRRQLKHEKALHDAALRKAQSAGADQVTAVKLRLEKAQKEIEEMREMRKMDAAEIELLTKRIAELKASARLAKRTAELKASAALKAFTEKDKKMSLELDLLRETLSSKAKELEDLRVSESALARANEDNKRLIDGLRRGIAHEQSERKKSAALIDAAGALSDRFDALSKDADQLRNRLADEQAARRREQLSAQKTLEGVTYRAREEERERSEATMKKNREEIWLLTEELRTESEIESTNRREAEEWEAEKARIAEERRIGLLRLEEPALWEGLKDQDRDGELGLVQDMEEYRASQVQYAAEDKLPWTRDQLLVIDGYRQAVEELREDIRKDRMSRYRRKKRRSLVNNLMGELEVAVAAMEHSEDE